MQSLPLARSYELLYPSTLLYTASLGCLRFPTPKSDLKITKSYGGHYTHTLESAVTLQK